MKAPQICGLAMQKCVGREKVWPGRFLDVENRPGAGATTARVGDGFQTNRFSNSDI
jgi:hypothetical protein